ncbi:ParB N-terminal domain-containing protein [Rhizobium freirei]|uniref:ParB N-terminal domain-containing protein n=1 Tax=Rhizobium freirei TaxID=1353277 RepID=UPI00068675D6|nr:ParB N-terminal domain-containing protein [Rhizobium freirei]
MKTGIVQYQLLDPRKLIPTEEIDNDRVIELEREIVQSGRWTRPITAHRADWFVMDGHHRLTIAQRLCFRVLPVVLLDYDTVRVEAWRPGETITPDMISAMARSGRRFPSKTTRHIFEGAPPACDIPLKDLRHPNAVQSTQALEAWAKPSMSPD